MLDDSEALTRAIGRVGRQAVKLKVEVERKRPLTSWGGGHA
jgi:hypothetical protein